MSWEARWQLPAAKPDLAGIAAALERLVLLSSGIFRYEIVPDGSDSVDCTLHVAAQDALSLIRIAAPSITEPDLESPAGDEYVLSFTLFSADEHEDEDKGFLSLYSNENDNREGWSIVAAVVIWLADQIGATGEDNLENDPIQVMGFNPSAVLKPKN